MDFKLSDDQELIVQAYKDYMESEPWDQYFLECDEKHEYPLLELLICAISASIRSCFPRAMAVPALSSLS